MKTDVLTVSSRGNGIDRALGEAEKVAAYKGLSEKNKLHLLLLTEEMMGMMRSLTGETEGLFWIEDEEAEYRLHLKVETIMDFEKREQLLAVSSSGKNESSKGLMGKIRDFFDMGACEELSGPMMVSSFYDESTTPLLDWEWSMQQYETSLARQIEQNQSASAREAWDELEKSVVAHVADDIKVSIRGRQVEMIILKKMA